MWRPSITTFADQEQFEAEYRAEQTRVTVIRPGSFHGVSTRIISNRLWVSGARFSGPPMIDRWTPAPGRIGLLMTDQPVMRNGVWQEPGQLMLWTPRDGDYYNRLPENYRFRSLSLPMTDIDTASRALLGRETVGPGSIGQLIQPPAEALEQLRRWHRFATGMAETDLLLRSPEVVKDVEELLVRAMINCLSAEYEPVSIYRHLQAPKMRLLEDLIEASEGRRLTVTQVCQAMAVPERTLRTWCHAWFGMGPARYLLYRRIHMVRQSLLRRDGRTVAEVAAAFGFTELGRFAGQYRRLFGETPSSTR